MSPVEATRARPPLERAGRADISRLVGDYRQAKLLFVAAKIDLFSFLSQAPATSERIARGLRLDHRAARIFLDALTATGFLKKTDSLYSNTETAELCLVEGHDDYVGDNLKYQDFLWDSWSQLETTLRRGAPAQTLDLRLRRERPFVTDYIGAMNNISRLPARKLAEALGPSGPGTLLDVGGGPGQYAAALLTRNPGLRAVILDLPGSLRAARALLKTSPLKRRIRLLAGDYHQAALGSGCYDLILLSHVTHNESRSSNRSLIRRCRSALTARGKLVIHDFMTDESRTLPVFPALFSAHMLVSTRAGQAYSAGDYERWLRRSGLRIQEQRTICPDAPNSTEMMVACPL